MSTSLSKRGSVTVGRDTDRNGVSGMLSEIVCQKETESWNFIFSTCPPRECVRLHCQTLWSYSFSLHLSSCPTRNIKHGWCQGESFVSVPEMTLIPVKLTLCEVSRLMLSPGFSIFTFILDEAQTKEMSLHSFFSFVLWFTLLLLTWLKHPGELIYDISPQGTQPSSAAGVIYSKATAPTLLREDSKISARFIEVGEKAFPPLRYCFPLV